MAFTVTAQMTISFELFVAFMEITSEWPLSSMDSEMDFQTVFFIESFVAETALVWFFTSLKLVIIFTCVLICTVNLDRI